MSDDDSSRSDELKLKSSSIPVRRSNLAASDESHDDPPDPSSKKRKLKQEDPASALLTPEDFSKMSRSERKRHREKKRRSDVNKGFDDLMALLLEIDPEVRAEAEERARRGQFKGSMGAQEDNLLSRVDLITRTVDVLRRVHRENEERKLIIANLTKSASVTNAHSISESTQSSIPGAMRRAFRTSQQLGYPLIETAGNDSLLQVSTIFPPLGRSNADNIAIRAAVERNQLQTAALLSDFRDPILGGIAGQRSLLLGNPVVLPNERTVFNTLGRNLSTSAAASSVSGLPLISAHATQNFPFVLNGSPSDLNQRYLQLLQAQEAASAARYGQASRQPSSSSNQYDSSKGNSFDMNRQL